jgi:hypothetical protein
MGAIADAFVAYARPLLDQTDGSQEQLNKAFSISQLCYNLAMMPEDHREQMLVEMKSTLKMEDKEFEDFQRLFIGPMIERHQEMFPMLHGQRSRGFSVSDFSGADRWADAPSAPTQTKTWGAKTAASSEAYPGTGRYAPCPCNSGRKYKFCCGAKRG